MANHHNFAKTPPMGWNSWDCYGASVREEEVRANAKYMAEKLKKYGWQYIVVDIQWYEPSAKSNEYNDFAPLEMDEYGRLMPAVNRFPSAKDGAGFGPLAHYVHGLGLKFGIHILRGIPRQAVRAKTKVLGTEYTAADIADTSSVCEWNTDMYGVDPAKPGAQEYYNSIFDLYACWGVDYIKVDDISRPYRKGEVELIRRAIDRCGRDIVLSLSPGAAPLSEAEHLINHANMWRMADDLWDNWKQLYETFALCEIWQPYVGEGHWPDADMLPLGRIGIRSMGGSRYTNFSRDEQETLMALWCIFRSPLMFGGDMTLNDEWTLSLMTNEELIEILNHSCNNRLVSKRGAQIVWSASSISGDEMYIAQFNTGESEEEIITPLADLGLSGEYSLYNIFTRSFEGRTSTAVANAVKPHGVKLYKLTKL